jgi:hypothetical protein
MVGGFLYGWKQQDREFEWIGLQEESSRKRVPEKLGTTSAEANMQAPSFKAQQR